MKIKNYPGLHFQGTNFAPVEDTLATEEALSITINDIPFTITMRTPGQETELIRGLLFTEGIYTDPVCHPLTETTGVNEEGYITSMNVVLPENKIRKEFSGSRSMMSVSSCGLCGKTTLEEPDVTDGIHENGMLDPSIINMVFKRMNEVQETFQRSGGTHASGAFTLDGRLLSMQEDIGRHNAADKVIGDLLNRNILPVCKILTVSGRLSFEIVSKARMAGIPFLASVSAPSSLAVETADKAGMTLMAFCRQHRLTVYTHPERVLHAEPVQVNR